MLLLPIQIIFLSLIVLNEGNIVSDANKRKKVFLDTDFGVDVDDTLALLLLLSQWKSYELIGIHTVGSDSLMAGRMVQKYVTWMGFGSIPVFVGCNHSLTEGVEYPKWSHLGKGVLEPDEYEYWDQYLSFNAPPVTLYNEADYVIAIGPLTNLAHLFQLDDQYHINSLILMGGSMVRDIYNEYKIEKWTLQKDYNLRIDPDAAIAVLGAEDRVDFIAMITGNITLQCWMNEMDLLRMKRVSNRYSFMNIAVNQIEIWSEIQRKLFVDPVSEDNTAFLHDPLALSVLFGHEIWSNFITMERMKVRFAKNEYNLLHSLLPGDLSKEKEGFVLFDRDIMVSTKVNCDYFRNFFFDQVLNFEYPSFNAWINEDIDECDSSL